jgi:hypothetical protein
MADGTNALCQACLTSCADSDHSWAAALPRCTSIVSSPGSGFVVNDIVDRARPRPPHAGAYCCADVVHMAARREALPATPRLARADALHRSAFALWPLTRVPCWTYLPLIRLGRQQTVAQHSASSAAVAHAYLLLCCLQRVAPGPIDPCMTMGAVLEKDVLVRWWGLRRGSGRMSTLRTHRRAGRCAAAARARGKAQSTPAQPAAELDFSRCQPSSPSCHSWSAICYCYTRAT